MLEEEPKTIHDLDHQTVMHMMRIYGTNIALLAKRGDPLSVTVKLLYENFYDHRNDPRAMRAFRDAFRDWLRQHLEITSRVELARKFGYLVEGEAPSEQQRTIAVQ